MKINYLVIPLIALATAVLGSHFTSQGMDWYETLSRPGFTPPGGIIGTVWTVIYILSAISALIVWNKFSRNKRFLWISALFMINAVLNFFWCYLFFAAHLIGAAIIEMLALEATVLALMILVWPRSRFAAFLLAPYAGWVIFATYLAYSIWALNS
ncbi:tryptophan-rich sensory protein [Patescibacteria group bacterium]|nr:tryptophan-rich sensory protein [Patescibacteria group bacterium]MBU1921710.1 tryptophan-rich sensory protein [Patescibacteria group bacterium]